jgi:hypothetical protein
MKNTTRGELLEQLDRLGELAPDMRLGQLIANLANMCEGPWDETLWDLEDEKLLAAANQLVSDFQPRTAPVR